MSAFAGPSVPSLTHRNVKPSLRSSLRSSFVSPWTTQLAASRVQRAHLQAPAMSAAAAAAAPSEPLVVMVNGLPGKMAAATAEEVVRRGLILADEAMTGANMDSTFAVTPQHIVKLCAPDEHDASLRRMRERHARVVIVDYTHPTAANANVERYAAHGLSFVIGTTGGDATDMNTAVMRASDVYAVIAPNMGKQIVAFQAMMRQMAEQFPSVFSGYTLSVKESHQSTKADTSGTAKAVVDSISKMGVVDFSVDQIDKVRTTERSIGEMNVPEDHVTSGHAFHTYHLKSEDGTVDFEFQHNVVGRRVYAAGTVDAVQFLDSTKQAGATEKRIFNMIDVLGSGTMS